MNKKSMLLALCWLALANVASAVVNVPSGVTGLWRFQTQDPNTGRATMAATIGTDLVNSNANNGSYFTAPSIQIGTDSSPFLYQDSGVAQSRSFDTFTATHGIAPNGGGSFVNEYTILWDYKQTSNGNGNYNSLYQTAGSPNANDGDLWTNPNNQIGVGNAGNGEPGYSAASYDPFLWHRIVLSVDNGNFFRAYVDGVLFLDGAGQPIDGRWSLGSQFHFLTDNNFEDGWGLLGTGMVWDHALTTQEVAAMGGYAADQVANPFPTPLVFADPVPEPSSMILFGMGLTGLLAVRRRS
ncbi:PEP-CTERM sorting domain-containing protein [Bythopirellula polymerisocia]|uniref:PEP-CTERM motif protein n=1 Tax=Bythopirellula polymerisocia TaxID=2528003 RepID=A0A5C6CNQ8_9BACT|nr:PEP-CTERM sorting domain-containing protein [Bythopirellula polymerisocia]TWU26018.1 PEP-CTERM motif protein [Bythopirellula polymerisocia]